jgi:O-antigen/teichoic acid export membrane protein
VLEANEREAGPTTVFSQAEGAKSHRSSRLWSSDRRRSASRGETGNRPVAETEATLTALLPPAEDPASLGSLPVWRSGRRERTSLREIDDPPVRRRGTRSIVGITSKLTAVSFAGTAIALITSPLPARALGPAGRGDLAAITVPLGLAPTILTLGLGVYVMRQSARKRSLAVVVGSIGPILLALGVLAACAAPLVATGFSGGRPVVYTWVLIGFLIMPLSTCGWLLTDIAAGRGLWNRLIVSGSIVPLGTLIAFVVLFVLGSLTVASAAAVTLVFGTLSMIPLLPLARQIGRPRFDRRVLREGLIFGPKAWLGGLGSLVNVRLDQLLMIRLVAPRELGLYAVAVTASTFIVNPVLSAISAGVIPRSATEDFSWLGRVLRTTILGVVAVGGLLALTIPVALPLVFGGAFAGAVPMVWVLLVGTIPLAGVNVLSTVLTLSGRPGFSAISELVAVGVTVPGLIIVLPIWGGIGAAVVSGVAYSLNFAILLICVKRSVQVSWRDLLIFRHEDIELLVERLAAIIPARLRRHLPAVLLDRCATSVIP